MAYATVGFLPLKESSIVQCPVLNTYVGKEIIFFGGYRLYPCVSHPK